MREGAVSIGENGAATARRRLLWLGLVAITLTTSIASYISMAGEIAANHRHVGADFIVFWTAAQVPQPYDFQALTDAQAWHMGHEAIRPFAYPPSFLPWIAPLSRLPLFYAFFLWVAATLALFAFTWGRAVRARDILLALAAPTVLLAAIPGQVIFLLGALIAGGLALIQRRPLVAGALLGIAATMKPQAVLLVPLALAAGRHWRALLAVFATGTSIGTVSLLVQGPALWRAWIEAMPAFMQVIREGGMIRFGTTPASMLEVAHIDGVVASAVLIAVGAIGIAAVWSAFRRSEDLALRFLALNCGTLLLLPYAMPYELAMSAPAAMVLLLNRGRDPALALAAMLALTAIAGAPGLVAICLILIWTTLRADPVLRPLRAALAVQA